MKNKQIISLILATTLLFAGCGKTKIEQSIDSSNNVATQDTDTPYFTNVGAYDPNDTSRDKNTCDFTYIPTIYMQDYDIKMPNGKKVSNAGNLVTCVSMIASYLNCKWIEPDNIINEYPQLFDNSGNLILKDALNEFSGEGTYDVMDYDFNDMAVGLADTYDFCLVKIPHPSKYGNLSTYLIIEGFTEDMKAGVRDPNKANILAYAEIGKYDYMPMYDVGDLIISLGQGTKMYMFYGTRIDYSEFYEDEYNEYEEVHDEEY